jgi:hypothetical protein
LGKTQNGNTGSNSLSIVRKIVAQEQQARAAAALDLQLFAEVQTCEVTLTECSGKHPFV